MLMISEDYIIFLVALFSIFCILSLLRKLDRLRIKHRTVLDLSEQQAIKLVEREEEVSSLREDRAELRSTIRFQEAQIEAIERRHEEDKEELLSQFKALSGDVLEQNSNRFLTLAREVFDSARSDTKSSIQQGGEKLEQLVYPLNQRLLDMETMLTNLGKERSESFARLETQVTDLVSLQSVLQKETHRLSRALQTPLTRGKWGEMQLKRILEYAGLLEHCHFLSTPQVQSDGGARLYPDVVLSLPGNRCIVIDAKAPLQALLEDNDDTPERVRASRKQHCKQLKDHIKKLSSKSYSSYVDGSPDFVIMFLPAAPLLQEALEIDPELLEFATGRQIIPATPLSLLVLLKTIAFTWQEEKARSHALQIKRLGGDLLNHVYTLLQSMDQLGKGLDKSVTSYNRTLRVCEKAFIPGAKALSACGLSPASKMPTLEKVVSSVREIENSEQYRLPTTESVETEKDS